MTIWFRLKVGRAEKDRNPISVKGSELGGGLKAKEKGFLRVLSRETVQL